MEIIDFDTFPDFPCNIESVNQWQPWQRPNQKAGGGGGGNWNYKKLITANTNEWH